MVGVMVVVVVGGCGAVADCGPHLIQVLKMGGSVWLVLVDHLQQKNNSHHSNESIRNYCTANTYFFHHHTFKCFSYQTWRKYIFYWNIN